MSHLHCLSLTAGTPDPGLACLPALTAGKDSPGAQASTLPRSASTELKEQQCQGHTGDLAHVVDLRLHDEHW